MEDDLVILLGCRGQVLNPLTVLIEPSRGLNLVRVEDGAARVRYSELVAGVAVVENAHRSRGNCAVTIAEGPFGAATADQTRNVVIMVFHEMFLQGTGKR